MLSNKSTPIAEQLRNELKGLGIELSECIAGSRNSLLLRGSQTLLARQVAVKILQQEYSETDYARFQQETKLLASFDHPNIVKLYGAGKLSDGRAYMVLEYLPGKSLAELLAEGSPMTESRIIKLSRQICAALSYAHDKGVVHRDIKPGNVMIVEEHASELVKLIDFGICKVVDEADAQKLTQSGAIPGTVNYMSPEQCRAFPLDARSDIYSLGCLLYELCCGVPPMQADSDFVIMSNHLNLEISKLKSRLPISASLEKCILRCLAKSPDARFSSAMELSRELESARTAPPAISLRSVLIPAFSVLAICGLSAYVLCSRSSQSLPQTPVEAEPADYDFNLRKDWQQFCDSEKSKGALKETRCRKWLRRHALNPSATIANLSSCLAYCGEVSTWTEAEKVPLRLLTDRCERESRRLERLQNSCSQSRYECLALLFKVRLMQERTGDAEEVLDRIFLIPCSEKDLSNRRLHDVLDLMSAFRVYGQPQDAERIFKKYFKYYPPGEEQARLYYCLADNSLAQGRRDDADRQYRLAAVNYERSRSITDKKSLAQFLSQLNKAGLLEITAGMRLPVNRLSLDNEDVADCYLEIARAYLLLGKMTAASPLMQKIETADIPSEKVKVLLHTFQVYRAINVDNRTDCKVALGSVLDDLDNLETRYGEQWLVLQLACKKYPDFVELCRQRLADLHPYDLAVILAWLGHDSRDNGKNSQAVSYYEDGLKYMLKSGTKEVGLAMLLVGYASSLHALNQKEDAYKMLDRAQAHLGPERVNCDEYFCVTNARADLLRADGKLEKAIAIHKQELERLLIRAEKLGNGESYSLLLLDLAYDYKYASKFDDCVRLLEENMSKIKADTASKQERLKDMQRLLAESKAQLAQQKS